MMVRSSYIPNANSRGDYLRSPVEAYLDITRREIAEIHPRILYWGIHFSSLMRLLSSLAMSDVR